MKKNIFLQVSLLITLLFVFVFIFSSPAGSAESQEAEIDMTITNGKNMRRTLSHMMRKVPPDSKICFRRLLEKHSDLLDLQGGKETEILFSRCGDQAVMIAVFGLTVGPRVKIMQNSQTHDSLINGLANYIVNKAHASEQPKAVVFLWRIPSDSKVTFNPSSPKDDNKGADDSAGSNDNGASKDTEENKADDDKSGETGVSGGGCFNLPRSVC